MAVLREGRTGDELESLDRQLGLDGDDDPGDTEPGEDDDDDPYSDAEQAESDNMRAALLAAGYGQIVSS